MDLNSGVLVDDFTVAYLRLFDQGTRQRVGEKGVEAGGVVEIPGLRWEVGVAAKGGSIKWVVVGVVEEGYVSPVVCGEVGELAKFEGVMVEVAGENDGVGVECVGVFDDVVNSFDVEVAGGSVGVGGREAVVVKNRNGLEVVAGAYVDMLKAALFV